MIVDAALYVDGRREGARLTADELLDAVGRGEGFVWVGMHEPDESSFDRVAEVFGIHPLAVEDAVKAHQRPKLEIYGDVTYVVLKTATYLEQLETVEFGEIQIFLGPRFVVVVRHGSPVELTSTRRKVEAEPDFLRLGPSAVLHAVVDRVVDEYVPVLDGIQDDLGELELQVFGVPEPADASRIYMLKRETLGMERAARPLAAVMDRLAHEPHDHVHPEVRPYFRDVQDHLVRAVEQLEIITSLLTSMLDANLSQISVRQNEDMRKISAWVAIAAVPTMLAGIWGMNFDHMPELDWTVGYPVALVLMAAIAYSLWRTFHRSGWL